MAEQGVTDVCRITVRRDGIYQSHWGPSGMCEKPAKCIHCSGDHPANSNQCPKWQKERKILKIKRKNNIQILVNNMSNFTQVKSMQVLLNQSLATDQLKQRTKVQRQTTPLQNTQCIKYQTKYKTNKRY